MKKSVWVALLLIVSTALPIWADDTEIYGTVTNPDLEPNILIIFDSSGSMSTVDVPGDPYDPATVYTGSYSTYAVYERYWKTDRTVAYRRYVERDGRIIYEKYNGSSRNADGRWLKGPYGHRYYVGY